MFYKTKKAKNDLGLQNVLFADSELSEMMSNLYEEYRIEMGLTATNWNPEAGLGDNTSSK